MATILRFNDVAAFNCALCDLIAHLTFQMRKVLATRNSSQTTRRSPLGSEDGWARDYNVLSLCWLIWTQRY